MTYKPARRGIRPQPKGRSILPVCNKFEYSFTPSKEYIRETHDMSPEAKMQWLEEANRFVREVVPKKKIEKWRKITGRD